MAPHLGIDLGTTYTAAVAHDGERLVPVRLGTRTEVMPTVVALDADGVHLVGEAAERLAVTAPDRVARAFKRRFGDDAPMFLGHHPQSVDELFTVVLAHIALVATQQLGAPPAAVTVTHPATWNEFRLEKLRTAARAAGLPEARLLAEPVAAAAAYGTGRRLEEGSVLAVYDLGGGTFDATIVRGERTGFRVLGRPEGVDQLGGVDVDHAVFEHVARSLGEILGDLDAGDPNTVAALDRLRRECVEAKEALSQLSAVDIPVPLPGIRKQVRLTRAELEETVRPTITTSVDTLHRAIDAAGVAAADLTAVLLAGGASSMPLVGRLVAESLGCPVAQVPHPKRLVAEGAALDGRPGLDTSGVPVPPRPDRAEPLGAPEIPPPPRLVPAPPPRPRSRRRGPILATIGVGAIAVAVVALALTRDRGIGALLAAETTTTGTTEKAATSTTSSLPTTTAPAGYTDAVRSAFVEQCVAGQQAAGVDPTFDSAGFCRCVIDQIEREIPFERFEELDVALAEGTNVPDDVREAIEPCIETFSG